MKKMILSITIAFLLSFAASPSVCRSQTQGTTVSGQSNFLDSQDEKKPEFSKSSRDTYWTLILVVFAGLTIPIIMIVLAAIVIQRKRKNVIKPPETGEKCSNCGHKVRDYALYCEMCGNDLKNKEINSYAICPLCKIPMKQHSQSCVRCGISLH